MRNLTPASITQAFADYAKNAPSPRTRTLLVSLAGHLHSFVRENKLTQAEWTAAIDALTRATAFTDDKRNEYILFSDLLGVSSLVDMVNAATSGTPSSVLGPFHIEGAPELANGGDLWRGQVGEPLVVSGKVTDENGAPAKSCRSAASPTAPACRPILSRATSCPCRYGRPGSISTCRRPDAAGLMRLVGVHGASKVFANGVQALSDVSLDVEAAEFLSV